jgi:hypothetical protein
VGARRSSRRSSASASTRLAGRLSRPTWRRAMSSLRELAGGRPIDNDELLDAFLAASSRATRHCATGLRRRRLVASPATTGRHVEVLTRRCETLTGRALAWTPRAARCCSSATAGARRSIAARSSLPRSLEVDTLRSRSRHPAVRATVRGEVVRRRCPLEVESCARSPNRWLEAQRIAQPRSALRAAGEVSSRATSGGGGVQALSGAAWCNG